jgi:MFS family permease
VSLLERIRDRNVWLVYATIFLLGVAYGASLSVTPLQLAFAKFTKPEIGALAAFFAGGLVLGSVPAGRAVRTFSAKRTLLACLAVYAVAVVLFPLQRTLVGAGVVRAFDGASSVGVWVACETVLLARSDRRNKAFVMSLYGMAIAVGYVAGSGLARLVVLAFTYREVFFVAGAIAVAAALLVLARLDPAAQTPPEEEHEGAPAAPSSLFWNIKTSCMATFSYGYFQASVVLFLPLYLVQDKAVPAKSTILMTAFFAGGMLVFSPFAARVGDAIGHLRTMTVLACVGVAMILGFVWLDSWPWMLGAIFVAGATLASISPVSLALQGHVTRPRDYSRANAMYNACYALGMLVGPPISSAVFEDRGGRAMLFHFAALWGCFIAATVVFRRDDPRAAPRPDAALAAKQIT